MTPSSPELAALSKRPSATKDSSTDSHPSASISISAQSDKSPSPATTRRCLSRLETALNSVVENVINKELADKSGIVSIDLKTGKIKIDLAKVVEGGNGEDLNGLDPNTQVLTSETISKITTAVSDALGALTERVNDTVSDALNKVHLKIELPAEIRALVPLVEGNIIVDATLGQLAGTDTTAPKVSTDMNLLDIIPVGDLLNAITEDVVDAVLGITKPLIGGILE